MIDFTKMIDFTNWTHESLLSLYASAYAGGDNETCDAINKELDRRYCVYHDC